MRDHISVSQIKLYLACPLKYRFVYIDELPRPFKPSGMALGSAIHSSIEWLHKQRIAGDSPDRDQLIKIFSADWEAQKVDNILFRQRETEEEVLRMGKEMLALYSERVPQTKPRAAELPFRVPLTDLETGEMLDLPLDGVVDLIEEDDTVVEIKTSARSLDAQGLTDYLQLTAYGYAYTYLYRKTPGLRLDNLIKGKKARIEQVEIQRDRGDYVRLVRVAGEVLKGIGSDYFCPNPSWMCPGCEYQINCHEWRG